MNKKGQALVEFILILPILIFIILALVDIGKLNVMKMHLESVLSNVNENTDTIKDKNYEIFLNKKETSITNFSLPFLISLKTYLLTLDIYYKSYLY